MHMMETRKLRFYSWEFQHGPSGVLPFSQPSIAFPLSPCLSSPWICPGPLSLSGHILGVSSLPFSWSQDSVWTAGYIFHLWSHSPGMYSLTEIHPLGLCQVSIPSVPKRTEKLLPSTETPLGVHNRLHVCCGCWRSVSAGGWCLGTVWTFKCPWSFSSALERSSCSSSDLPVP